VGEVRHHLHDGQAIGPPAIIVNAGNKLFDAIDVSLLFERRHASSAFTLLAPSRY
jgi:hypothetical protein